MRANALEARRPDLSWLGPFVSESRAGGWPFHGGRDISPTLLRKIARDIGLTVDELLGNN